jgi:hypothetical protein
VVEVPVHEVERLPRNGDYAMPPPLSRPFDRWIAALDASP